MMLTMIQEGLAQIPGFPSNHTNNSNNSILMLDDGLMMDGAVSYSLEIVQVTAVKEIREREMVHGVTEAENPGTQEGHGARRPVEMAEEGSCELQRGNRKHKGQVRVCQTMTIISMVPTETCNVGQKGHGPQDIEKTVKLYRYGCTRNHHHNHHLCKVPEQVVDRSLIMDIM